MRFLLAAAMLAIAQPVSAEIHLLLESDANLAGGSELYLVSFDSFSDLLDGTVSGSNFSQIDVAGSYSAGGLTFTNSFSAPAVPEPSTWAMMLLGFGAAGLAMRRRRQNELIFRRAT